ncbi:MAG: hypothetical protein ACI4IL_01810 [Eubacterium sp.]
MKNAIKIIIIILAIPVVCFLGSKLYDGVYYAYARISSIHYLSEKYDEPASEFELLDYNKPHIYWKQYGDFFFEQPIWVDFSLEYKYNDRNFIVSRKNKVIYDDYQLEDVQKWCTQWLKENVDERIIGFLINDENILRYSTFLGYDYVIQENNAYDFLKSCFAPTEYAVFIYNDPNGRMSIADEKEFGEKIREKLHLALPCDVDHYEGTDITIHTSKTGACTWWRFY